MSTKISFFGATTDTSNLGVSALSLAVTHGLLDTMPGLDLMVFDNTYGLRSGTMQVGDEQRAFSKFGARTSKRYYRHDTLHNIMFSSRFGGLFNPGSRFILKSTALVDISGGDSFTDLYGKNRYKWVSLPKHLALNNNIPLVLLPQTYGPFATEEARSDAASIVKRAHCCWARDARSYEVLQELLGKEFDPARHRCGVDVAFLLPKEPYESCLAAETVEWLQSGDEEIAGLNVSGLIYSSAERAREQYGFRADYKKTVRLVVEGLARKGAKVALIPHVMAGGGGFAYESDPVACQAVLDAMDAKYRHQVRVIDGNFNASQIKQVINSLAWFCGTRMHSTIGSLSSGVPTSSIAYSDKARGVFESCGQGEQLIDPRVIDTDDCVRQALKSWDDRQVIRESLAKYLPSVLAEARDQMRSIAGLISSL